MFSFIFLFCIRRHVFVYNRILYLEPEPIFVKVYLFVGLHDPTAKSVFKNSLICFQFGFFLEVVQFILKLESVKKFLRRLLLSFVLRAKLFKNVSSSQKLNIQPVSNPIPK